MGWERASQAAPSARYDIATQPTAAGRPAPVDVWQLAALGGNAAIIRLLRNADGQDAPAGVPDGFQERLGGAGHALPDAHKSTLAAGLGVSLDGVRLHTDSTAADLAGSVSARAFTVGSDIYFGAGNYQPETTDGYRLLAHEVTHVVQQSGTAVAPAGSSLSVSSPDSPAELEAERVADRLVVGRDATALETAGPSVHRDPAPATPADGASVSSPEQEQLSSSDPDINGKTVDEVGADLGARDARYRHVIGSLKANSEATLHDEQDWYDNLGLMGGFIDWFNPVPKTDPARWQDVLQRWDTTAGAFDAVLTQPITPKTINPVGQASAEAMKQFDETYRLDADDRAQYANYLQGFAQSAQTVLTVSTIVRDVAFAVAVGIVVVSLAPAVAGVLASSGAGTLLTYGGTAVAMGGVGAAIEGVGQGVSTLGAQASAALVDLVRGSERAADNFDMDQVFGQGWEGMQRGFVDGVLAFAGTEAEKLIASAAGPVIKGMLGSSNSGLMAMIIRRSLTRAVSGGATGSVIGSLQAGLMAALNGDDLSGIAAAMQQGFVVGMAVGTTLGAGGGAFEARSAFQMRQAVLPELRQAAETSGYGPAVQQAAFDDLRAKLLANPGVGTNDQLVQVLPDVWAALRSPEQIADAMTDVWLEERLLGVLAPRDAASRYGQAAMALSARAGAPVVVLGADESFGIQEFYDQVVLKGNRFLDLAVLSDAPDHGASTHAIQDLVADKALSGTGLRAEQVRAMFAGAVDADGKLIGNDLWITIYDAQVGGLNQPEVVYPIMAKGLGALR
jgi:hypothetical protein